MKNPAKSVLSAARRKPLAACCVALFALAAPEAFAATTWPVTNCNDSGSGSLRDIVTNSAVTGDTVDLSGLNGSNCYRSTITLTTGAITIPQNTLTLKGPSSHITITGYDYNSRTYMNDRLINHTGSGTLYVLNLNIWNSQFSPPTGEALGGCIYSDGGLALYSSSVSECHLIGTGIALGGGIYANNGAVKLKYSQVTANSVVSKTLQGRGGGVFASRGYFTVKNSTINGNSADLAGGVAALLGATIQYSTISGNHAASFAGGLYAAGGSSQPIAITNSTISGNSAGTGSGSTGTVGGASLDATSITIQNSTIAFNTASNANPNAAPGVYVLGVGAGFPTTLNIESSILSNNTSGTTENDFSGNTSGGSMITITSNNNIIRAALGAFRPATVSTACPLLGPLRNNGGATQTHALMSHSPAIDAGNNNAKLNEDQRGGGLEIPPYPYPRVSGIGPDIGAYEVQQNDIIFNSGFEGCPAL